MKGRCFDMSAVAQLLKKPFKTPWSPPAWGRKGDKQTKKIQNKSALIGFFFHRKTDQTVCFHFNER